MSGLVYNGHDFGEFCRCRTVGMAPPVEVDGEHRVKVELALRSGRKLTPQDASRLRHKIAAALFGGGTGTLRLPEDGSLEYRGVSVADASDWENLLEDGKCTVAFAYEDPAAYGSVRVTRESAFEVEGTAATYPAFELVALEGDSVMVLDRANERFLMVMRDFVGGEVVSIDNAGETVVVDGIDASKDIALYSDFFALEPGAVSLVFTGCSDHVITYAERWI